MVQPLRAALRERVVAQTAGMHHAPAQPELVLARGHWAAAAGAATRLGAEPGGACAQRELEPVRVLPREAADRHAGAGLHGSLLRSLGASGGGFPAAPHPRYGSPTLPAYRGNLAPAPTA